MKVLRLLVKCVIGLCVLNNRFTQAKSSNKLASVTN